MSPRRCAASGRLARAAVTASAVFTACAAQAAEPITAPAEAAASGAADTAPPAAPLDTPSPRITSPKPLWELGLGVTGLSLPDYRGADKRYSYWLPLPYIVYRGTWLKSDREGTRALLFDTTRAKLDLSFGASVPTRGDTAAREGMPDLPGNLEVGPSLIFTLDEEVRKRWRLDLRLPLRAAVTIERSPRYAGTTFSPNLNLDLNIPTHGWHIGALTGPLFANRRYHAQYYEVAEAYARPDRPAYRARGGYAGWQTLVSTSKRFGNTWFGAFVRMENLQGAVYDDSPMVKRRTALAAGFGFSWVLATSATLVEASD